MAMRRVKAMAVSMDSERAEAAALGLAQALVMVKDALFDLEVAAAELARSSPGDRRDRTRTQVVERAEKLAAAALLVDFFGEWLVPRDVSLVVEVRRAKALREVWWELDLRTHVASKFEADPTG